MLKNTRKKSINYRRGIFNKNILLICFSILNILFLVSLFIFNDNYIYRIIKCIRISNIKFNNCSGKFNSGLVKEFKEFTDSNIKEVLISFQMKICSIKNYSNVFQTAPMNSGIRMEISEPASLGLILGSNNSSGLKGFLLTDSLSPKKWYSVKISVDRKKKIKVILDNTLVVNTVYKETNYRISDIAIGTGFSKTRPYYGALANFNIEYKMFKKRFKSIETVILIIKILLIFPLIKVIQLLKEGIKWLK